MYMYMYRRKLIRLLCQHKRQHERTAYQPTCIYMHKYVPIKRNILVEDL